MPSELTPLALAQRILKDGWDYWPESGHDARRLAVALIAVEMAREALATEVLAARGRTAWQPIETAPKDGTTLLVHHADLGHVLVLWFPDGIGSAANGDGDTNWKLDWDRSYLSSEPTHWMAVPAPPEEYEPECSVCRRRGRHTHACE